jgi:hypothetical protein
VVRGILHYQQAEMQAMPGDRGEELLWDRQPGCDKGKCLCDFRQLHLANSQEAIKGGVLLVSGSYIFCNVRDYLGSMGGGLPAWDFRDSKELTLSDPEGI